MKYLSTLSNVFASLVLFGLVAAVPTASNAAQDAVDAPHYFVDLLYLQHGKSAEDAEDYFARIQPIAARHGLKRVDTYAVTKTLSGNESADLINVWWVAGTATFAGISEDPEYKKLTAIRDSVFDMSRSLAFNADVSR